MLSMLPLHLAVVPVSCSFKKFVLSPQSTTFIHKFLSFFCSMTFKNVLLFLLKPTFHQTIDIKSSSATKQCAFDIQISK